MTSSRTHDDADFYAFPYVDARPRRLSLGCCGIDWEPVKAIEKAVPSLKNGEYYKNKGRRNLQKSKCVKSKQTKEKNLI